MKVLSVLLLAIVSLVLLNQSEAWPVAKAEVINVSEQVSKFFIPQSLSHSLDQGCLHEIELI